VEHFNKTTSNIKKKHSKTLLEFFCLGDEFLVDDNTLAQINSNL
jgi:hypothetical protein